MLETPNTLPTKKRGRPAGTKKTVETVPFDPSSINITKGKELHYGASLFVPMKTKSEELNTILSTDGGLMPATNMILIGGPGTGKTTVTLDALSGIQENGKRCLFISGEMDEIGYFKYCQRLPHFNNVEVLFLKNHAHEVKSVIEYVFREGYDVIAIDSIAEVLEMYKDSENCSKTSNAETWFLGLQDKVKLGDNKLGINTSFINIQQVTKGGDFKGSNRLKHMTDAMAHLEVNLDKTKRTIHFSKNRDCDKEFKCCFTFYKDNVFYSYETIK